MKKLFAMLITAAMLATASIPVFAAAAPAEPTTNVTITGVTGRTYAAYKLMSATNDGTNYAYVVNETYRAPLTSALKLAAAASDKEIIDAINNLKTAEAMRHFADDLYRAIQAAKITADASWAGETTTLAQAYWLVADVTDLEGKNESNSLVMLDTAGDADVTINAKPSTITTQKNVDDENDSLIDATSDYGEDQVILQDVADYDIGDEVPYSIDIRLPNNISEYDYYSFVIQDAVEEGLTYLEDTFEITLRGAKKVLAKKGDTTVENPDFYYEIITETDDNGVQTAQKLYVYPAKGYTDHTGAAKDASSTNGGDLLQLFPADAEHSAINSSVVIFKYKCLLNENAIIGIEGNLNTYSLKYSNNPYDDGFGNTMPDYNLVLTYKLVFDKINGKRESLAGADFELYKFIATDAPDAMTAEQAAEKSVTDGVEYLFHPGANAWGYFVQISNKEINTDGTQFTFNGMDDGFYKLVETVTPQGYNSIEPIEFRIIADHMTTISLPDEATLTNLEGRTKVAGEITFTPSTGAGSLSASIVNNSGTELPTTGGFGTTMMYLGGTALVAFAVVVLVTRKRMKIEA